MCEPSAKALNANLEKPNAAVDEFYLTSQISPMSNHCSRQIAQGVEFMSFFLPKFHCELNFIEQCWGRAKSIYRTYPPSSCEDDLERNTLQALNGIPLPMMRKYATQSRRFMDAYDRGLNGIQAAWAARNIERAPSVAAEYT